VELRSFENPIQVSVADFISTTDNLTGQPDFSPKESMFLIRNISKNFGVQPSDLKKSQSNKVFRTYRMFRTSILVEHRFNSL